MTLQLNRSAPLILASLGLLLGATRVPAQEHGSAPVVSMPTTYRAAVDGIDLHVGNIGRLIDEKKLANLHAEAAIIKKIADGMSKLVAAEGSGVPAAAYPEVLKASKALSALFGRVDAAGDSGNAEESRKAHAALVEQVVVLRKYAPVKQAAAPYTCPMHAEITSDAPGRCAKCGMDLEKKVTR